MKMCTKCKEVKPVTEFYLRDEKPRSHCKVCMNKDDRARQIKKYGITPDEYAAMLTSQGGVCAICANSETSEDYRGKRRELAIDHCHTTDKVRGLLCYTCNIGLGYFKDNIEMMEMGIEYLRRT